MKCVAYEMSPARSKNFEDGSPALFVQSIQEAQTEVAQTPLEVLHRDAIHQSLKLATQTIDNDAIKTLKNRSHLVASSQ